MNVGASLCLNFRRRQHLGTLGKLGLWRSHWKGAETLSFFRCKYDFTVTQSLSILDLISFTYICLFFFRCRIPQRINKNALTIYLLSLLFVVPNFTSSFVVLHVELNVKNKCPNFCSVLPISVRTDSVRVFTQISGFIHQKLHIFGLILVTTTVYTSLESKFQKI